MTVVGLQLVQPPVPRECVPAACARVLLKGHGSRLHRVLGHRGQFGGAGGPEAAGVGPSARTQAGRGHPISWRLLGMQGSRGLPECALGSPDSELPRPESAMNNTELRDQHRPRPSQNQAGSLTDL